MGPAMQKLDSQWRSPLIGQFDTQQVNPRCRQLFCFSKLVCHYGPFMYFMIEQAHRH